MVRIALLDDHALFRIGLAALLNKEEELEIIGEYKSFSILKPLIPSLPADVILVDLSLEEESGLEVAKYIKNVIPRLKVIILSSHKEEFYIANALEAGVDGYIHKDAEPAELISGIHKVLKGEKFFSLKISGLLITNIYSKHQAGLPYLTKKEKEVIKYLMEGYSSKEIADKMDVSPRTVETHRANALSKFNLRNTHELIKQIAEQKIKF